MSGRLRAVVLSFLGGDDRDPTGVQNAMMLLSENRGATLPTAVLDRLWSVLFGLGSGAGVPGGAPAVARAVHWLDCAFRDIMAADLGQDALRRMLATSERVGDICKTMQFVLTHATSGSGVAVSHVSACNRALGNDLGNNSNTRNSEGECSESDDDDEEDVDNDTPSISTLRVRLSLLCRVLMIDQNSVAADRAGATLVAEYVSSCWCATFAGLQQGRPAPKTLFLLPQVAKLWALFELRCKDDIVPPFPAALHNLFKTNGRAKRMFEIATDGHGVVTAAPQLPPRPPPLNPVITLPAQLAPAPSPARSQPQSSRGSEVCIDLSTVDSDDEDELISLVVDDDIELLVRATSQGDVIDLSQLGSPRSNSTGRPDLPGAGSKSRVASSASAIWEWEESGRWNPYSTAQSAKLEQAFTSRSSRVILMQLGTRYIVDVTALTQTNVSTGYCRRIRRRQPGDAACAGSVYTLNSSSSLAAGAPPSLICRAAASNVSVAAPASAAEPTQAIIKAGISPLHRSRAPSMLVKSERIEPRAFSRLPRPAALTRQTSYNRLSSVFHKPPRFDQTRFLELADGSPSWSSLHETRTRHEARGYLVPVGLVCQLKLTSTTRCSITLSHHGEGECLPWINVHGNLSFVSYDAYQRICRSLRDPTYNELVGAVRFRLCLEKLWFGLVQIKRKFARGSRIDSTKELFRNLGVSSPVCRMVIWSRFELATGEGLGASAVVGEREAMGSTAGVGVVEPISRMNMPRIVRTCDGLVRSDPEDRSAFSVFARLIETCRRHCILAWSETVREKVTAGELVAHGGASKRKRDEMGGSGGAAGGESSTDSVETSNSRNAKRMRR